MIEKQKVKLTDKHCRMVVRCVNDLTHIRIATISVIG